MSVYSIRGFISGRGVVKEEVFIGNEQCLIIIILFVKPAGWHNSKIS